MSFVVVFAFVFYPISTYESMRPGKLTTLRRTSPLPLFVDMKAYHPVEFQRLYTPTAFREEHILRRTVIQLNLKSISTILDALTFPSRARTISRPPLTNHPPFLPSKYEQYNKNGNDTTLTFGSSFPPRVNSPPHHHPLSPRPTQIRTETPSLISFIPSSTYTTHAAARAPTHPSHSYTTRLGRTESALVAPTAYRGSLYCEVGTTERGGGDSLGPCWCWVTKNAYRNEEIFVRTAPGWKGASACARVDYPGYGIDIGAMAV